MEKEGERGREAGRQGGREAGRQGGREAGRERAHTHTDTHMKQDQRSNCTHEIAQTQSVSAVVCFAAHATSPSLQSSPLVVQRSRRYFDFFFSNVISMDMTRVAGERQVAVMGWWLRCAFLLAILAMRSSSCGSVSCLQENELGASMGWQRSLSRGMLSSRSVCHCLHSALFTFRAF